MSIIKLDIDISCDIITILILLIFVSMYMKKYIMILWLACCISAYLALNSTVFACERPWFMVCQTFERVERSEIDDELTPLRLYQVQSTWTDTVQIVSAGDSEQIAMYGRIRNNSYRTMTLESIEFEWVGVQYIDVLRMYSNNPAVEDVLAQWFYIWNWKANLQLSQPITVSALWTYDFFLTIDIDPTTPTWSLIRVDHAFKAMWQNMQVFSG